MIRNTKDAPAMASYEDDLILHRAEATARMGDEEIYLEIAHYFAGNLADSLSELEQALNSGDTDKACRLAHSLKGNCATVGAEALREHCFTLERLCRSGEKGKAQEIFNGLAPKMLALRTRLLAL